MEARRRTEEEALRRREYEQEKARQETIARSKAETARRAMAAGGGGFGSGAGFGSGGGGAAYAWKRNSGAQQGAQTAGRGRQGKGGAPVSFADMPSLDECEMGIQEMLSPSQIGMKEGLALLGLPNYPLDFIRGERLVLCGHNVREEINAMIHAWMTDEKEEFYSCLKQVKDIVSKPLLTEEEFEMTDNKEQWVKVTRPDGQTMYAQRDGQPPQAPAATDDADDDEVIDVPPSGGAARLAGGAASQEPPASPPTAAGAALELEEDYYALLGVDPLASLHEIRTRFRALVVTEHPEKGGDPKKFQRLNKAYSVLSDQKKRAEFDVLRAAAAGIVAAGG